MTRDELLSYKDVLMLTPQWKYWNPNYDVYARNEEEMTDWEGNMIETRHRTRIMINDFPKAENSMVISSVISATDSKLIEEYIDLIPVEASKEFYNYTIAENSCDNVHAVLSGISSIYNPVKLHNLLVERRDVGTFAASIGSTTVGSTSHYNIDDETDEELENELSDDDNSRATVTGWDPELLDDFDVYLDDLILNAFVWATVGTKS